MSRHLFPLVFATLIGCAASTPEENTTDCAESASCDSIDPKTISCPTGAYDDDNCDLGCDAPDIDCFKTFHDGAAATEWFKEVLEPSLAASEGRALRPLVDIADPRYQDLQAQVAAGYKSYRQVVSMGELRKAPEVVIVDDPSPNAFVASDQNGGQAWAIFVHTGLLTLDQSESSLVGLIMHELEHAAQQHSIPGVKESILVGYQVLPGTAEPLGMDQNADPLAHEAVKTWLELASVAGGWPLEELNGLPLSIQGVNPMSLAMRGIRTKALANTPACLDAVEAPLFSLIAEHTVDLGSDFEVPASQLTELDTRTAAYFLALKDCLTAPDFDLLDVLAEALGAPRDALEMSLSPEELLLVTGNPHVVDQLQAMVRSAYTGMREVDDSLRGQTGSGVETLRYYSSEEAADDRTVVILDRMGLDPRGMAGFLGTALGREATGRCEIQIGRNETPSYGPLTDAHHSPCYRIAHIYKLAELEATPSSAREVELEDSTEGNLETVGRFVELGRSVGGLASFVSDR